MGTKLNLTAEMNDKYRVVTRIGGHEYVMDEPVSLGGDDTGTVPGGMLAVALAGCKAMVARVYADKHKLDLRKIEMDVEADFEENNGEYELVFTVDIAIDGDLDEQELARITRYINSACPVEKILTQVNTINTTVRMK